MRLGKAVDEEKIDDSAEPYPSLARGWVYTGPPYRGQKLELVVSRAAAAAAAAPGASQSTVYSLYTGELQPGLATDQRGTVYR